LPIVEEYYEQVCPISDTTALLDSSSYIPALFAYVDY